MVYTAMHGTEYKELTTDVTGQKVDVHETEKALSIDPNPPVCTISY